MSNIIKRLEESLSLLGGVGFTTAHRNVLEALVEIKSLRSQLAKMTREREQACEAASNNFAAVQEINTWLCQYDLLEIKHEGGGEAAGMNVVEALEGMRQQLLATQSHVARLVESLEEIRQLGEEYSHPCGPQLYNTYGQLADEALSTPINRDALHEDRARECERLKDGFPQRSPLDTEAWLDREAATHRSKKDQKLA